MNRRRERRQSAYLDFLDAVDAADRAIQLYFRDRRAAATEPVPVQQARVAEVRHLFEDAEQRGNRVLLEGPSGVAEAARKLIEVQADLVREVREFGQAHAAAAEDAHERAWAAEATGLSYMAARHEFIDVARAALDEVVDGS
ncbi:hypothetical protein AB0H49_07970 [Nocardia sp. NPDC050713]|uniref:hypothetical protein n=1 Tax=Nocardia sp. NPDC050713 TaxID=3154511 RepID=UPI0033C88410